MKKILIIEDDQKIAASLEIRFQANGYATVLAHDALQGTRLAVQDKPDLIILDISLPAGGGISIAENLNKLPHTKHLPIIGFHREDTAELRAAASWANCCWTVRE